MSTHGHDHKHKTHDHSHSGAVLHAPAAHARPTTTPPWRPGPTRKFQCGLRRPSSSATTSRPARARLVNPTQGRAHSADRTGVRRPRGRGPSDACLKREKPMRHTRGPRAHDVACVEHRQADVSCQVLRLFCPPTHGAVGGGAPRVTRGRGCRCAPNPRTGRHRSPRRGRRSASWRPSRARALA